MPDRHGEGGRLTRQMRTTSYRLRRAPWGIAIDLTAEASLTPEPPVIGELVADRVWLDLAPVLNHPPSDRSGLRITEDEAAWLRHGVALAAGSIAAQNPSLHTTVAVQRVLFPLTDYQPEGLAAAVLEWTEKEFSLTSYPVEAEFDQRANRYVYTW
ncbi:hypothetical protein [Streptomyces sp. NPDC029004]|uniref:hypothetical protein n=1 Tax=Streptomyces sp. NPDC029004 TaxID=3154490 RepID=UPI0033EDC420